MLKLSSSKESLISLDNFPIAYEQDKESAVLVDIVTFRKMQLIIENLIHRETEVEDKLLANEKDLLDDLIETCIQKKNYSEDWRAELDAL